MNSSTRYRVTPGSLVVFNSWSDGDAQYVGFHPASLVDCGPPNGSTCSYFVLKYAWTDLSNAPVQAAKRLRAGLPIAFFILEQLIATSSFARSNRCSAVAFQCTSG